MAPTTTKLPKDAKERKNLPIATGCLDYFPLALAEVAKASLAGNKQHLDGEPLHWDRSKSTDEADSLLRHFMERGKIDEDGVRHSGKMAWRALALLQKEMEDDQEPPSTYVPMAYGEKCRHPWKCDMSRGDVQCDFVNPSGCGYLCCTWKKGHPDSLPHSTGYNDPPERRQEIWIPKAEADMPLSRGVL